MVDTHNSFIQVAEVLPVNVPPPLANPEISIVTPSFLVNVKVGEVKVPPVTKVSALKHLVIALQGKLA